MLSIQNIVLLAGVQPLLNDASFTLHPGQKVGLIGQNGAGKTTLFKAILQKAHLDAGSIKFPSNWVLGYVEQEIDANDIAVLDFVTSGDKPYARIQTAIKKAERDNDHDSLVQHYDELDKISGYHVPQKAQQLLYGLGFIDTDFTRTIESFSGGWRVRLTLARALMNRADLLLLDEPTNHLDIEAVAWLIQYLKQFEGAIMVISHDRHFLDEVVQGIVHFQDQKLHYYAGNFAAFERQRNEKLMQQQSLHDKQKQQMQHLKSFIDRFKAKASKAKQAQSRVKALERMEEVAAVHATNPFQFTFSAPDHLPDPMLTTRKVTFAYEGKDHTVLDADFVLRAGDRIGLVGINGSGKSTLLKLLIGDLKPQSGKVALSRGVKFGYFAQHQLESLVMDNSPLQHLMGLSESLTDADARSFLGQFGFTHDKALEPVKVFSGGEKARLSMALMVFQKPNLIILDEPTNHLDMETRDALDMALQDFEGALILVTHDQHLLESIVDQYWWIHDKQVQHHHGDLETYLKQRLKQVKQMQVAIKETNALSLGDSESSGATKKDQRKESAAQRKQLNAAVRMQKKQLQKVETKLQKQQDKLTAIHSEMEDATLYEADRADYLKVLLLDESALKNEIESLEDEWMALEAEIEEITVGF